jgi:adenylate kinase
MDKGLILECDPKRKTKVVDMDALGQSLEKLITDTDRPIILDGHFSHELLDEQHVSLVIILRKAPWELHNILQNRLYSYEKVWENLEAEITGVISDEVQEYPIEKLHEVDTTGKTPMETAEEILEVIRDEKPRSYGPIDWITYPETLKILVNKTCTL